jgi:hypothetical protein
VVALFGRPVCATPLYDSAGDQVERVVAEADCGLSWCVPCLAGTFIEAAPALPTCTQTHPGAAGPCGRVLKGGSVRLDRPAIGFGCLDGQWWSR